MTLRLSHFYLFFSKAHLVIKKGSSYLITLLFQNHDNLQGFGAVEMPGF